MGVYQAVQRSLRATKGRERVSDITIKITDNSDEFIEILKSRIPVALEACGLQAERSAKLLCPVDTGRLRNSITHATAGDSSRTFSFTESYVSGVNEKGKKQGLNKKQKEEAKLSEVIPAIPEKEQTVFIGTNVEYAASVETGHILPNGSYTAPKPYLKPAIENNKEKYKAIMKRYLKG